jgi:hypothetical protein
LRRLGCGLRTEVLPDPGGLISFALLLVSVAACLAGVTHPEGTFAGGLIGLLPPGWRDPWSEAAVEGAVQACLIVFPGAAAYWGLRHLRTRGDSPVPILTVLGGASITAIYLLAIVCACLEVPLA